MTRRRVFMHIGLPKTGTTYLQQAIWGSKARLAEYGVVVPGRHKRRHLLASLDLREDPKLSRRTGDVAHPWQDLVLEAREHDADVLISHEFFAAAAPHQIQHAVDSFPDAEFHAVLAARPMVDLALAYWQEWVRNGGEFDVDSFPVNPHYDPVDEWGWGTFDLADVLERWRLALPEERIHVIALDPASTAPTELLHRFLGVLGLPVDAVMPPPDRVYESLGLVEIELLRRINPRLTDFRSAGERGRWIRGFLCSPRILATNRERLRPDDEHLADLVRRGDRAMAMLAEGDYDLVGELGWLASPDVGDRRHPSEVTDAEMLDSAAQAMSALLTRVREVTRERNALARELADRKREGSSVTKAVRRLTSRGSRD